MQDAPESEQALTRLQRAVATRKRAERAEQDAIVDALRTPGVEQKDVLALTGLSRETLRKLARSAGIPPARRQSGTKSS